MEFKQNFEMTYRSKRDAVEENYFLTKNVDLSPLPSYDDVKDKLPAPVWEGHEDALAGYWKAWEMAFGNLRKPTEGTGFVSPYIDTAFNGCTFMWDSAFMLMFGKYADRLFKFQETLDNFYSHQHKDGFICREINELTGTDRFTRFDPSATGPDIMAWCEWEYFLQFGDMERLAKVFPPLMAYHQWMAEHHTWPDGTYFSTGWGCGMDNIPRHMSGYSVEFSHGHMVWVDACMQALNNCKILINMADVLGRDEYIEELTAEQIHLDKVINEKLWDEESGFYYDLWKNGELNMVMHIGAFWALIAQCASGERAERMIAHLNDETKFKTPHRIPALVKNHELYSSYGEYWRGGVWAPTNYMVLKGLDNYQQFSLSHEIAKEHLDAVVETFRNRGTFFENYAPEYVNDGKPDKGNHSKEDFVGWTGLVPISIMFEFVFGIKPDAKAKRIVWDINLTEKHGVEKYPFGADGELTLICEKRDSVTDKPVITAISNQPVEIEVIWGNAENRNSFIVNVQH